MARPKTAPTADAPYSAPELVAELRRVRQSNAAKIAYFDEEAQRARRIDDTLRQALDRLGVVDEPELVPSIDRRLLQGLDDVRSQVEQLATQVEQLQKLWGRGPLVSEGFVIQATDVLKGLAESVQRAPEVTANAVALAVGAVLGDQTLTDGPFVSRAAPRPRLIGPSPEHDELAA